MIHHHHIFSKTGTATLKYTQEIGHGSVPGLCPHCQCRYHHHTCLCPKYHGKHTSKQCKVTDRTGMEAYRGVCARLYLVPHQDVRHLNIEHSHPYTNKARTTCLPGQHQEITCVHICRLISNDTTLHVKF